MQVTRLESPKMSRATLPRNEEKFVLLPGMIKKFGYRVDNIVCITNQVKKSTGKVTEKGKKEKVIGFTPCFVCILTENQNIMLRVPYNISLKKSWQP